jgi:hypothetical protein
VSTVSRSGGVERLRRVLRDEVLSGAAEGLTMLRLLRSCSTITTASRPPLRDPRSSHPALQVRSCKAATKRADDGLPVHSFQSLLAELTTFTRNTMAMAAAPHDTFLLYPQQTPTQLRAFELLAVQPRL